ncbi:energy transducer TonB [Frateuria defendens]|uniref:energy transducer TonB n=1 Tax=Frateuria defendens TaxID=2219559 RepID=UPI0009E282D9
MSMLAYACLCVLAMSSVDLHALPAPEQSRVHPPVQPTDTSPQLPENPDYYYPEITAPSYPEIAVQNHHEGRPQVLAALDQTGQVVQVKLYRTSGFRELDLEALSIVKGRRFTPCASFEPTHGKCFVTVPVIFKLPAHQSP